MKYLLPLASATLILTGCASHHTYDTAAFRHNPVEHKQVALHKDGLTAEQIRAISATRPPSEFPVDVAILIIKDGYVQDRVENQFTSSLINSLSASKQIGRITLIPDFLIPREITFNVIQELGVRSLSEYVLLFYMNDRELFQWTNIASGVYEINSSVSVLLVDSGTAAILTADRLYSTHEYKKNAFTIGEQREAQDIIFTEQGALLGSKLDELFSSAGGTHNR